MGKKTKILNVLMTLEVDEDAVDKVKVITHHADYLLDLDSWPEIKSVGEVTVEEKGSNEIDNRTAALLNIAHLKQVNPF